MSRYEVDVAVLGSGFSGSLLAWILSTRGLRVALIDPVAHPRFAIGESSTPIADLILRQLGEQYGLSSLVSLSRWGTWQQKYPQLACGLKRGFTYFQHQPDESVFAETTEGQRSLWVAASPNDAVADTHWYRPDVDTFFFEQAIESGVIDLGGDAAVGLEEANERVTLQCRGDRYIEVNAATVVDASGQAAITAQLRSLPNRRERLKTDTQTTFAHFSNVGRWSHCSANQIKLDHVPFDADDSAQHHLLDGRWVWMLRFDNGITSVGSTGHRSQQLDWSRWPALGAMFGDAKLVAPMKDGRVVARSTQRLQRLFDPWTGGRVMMMPTAAATIDPMHSTGIAHALAGVQRLANVLTAERAEQPEMLRQYRSAVVDEVHFLDSLVATAYASMGDFERFTLACNAYFLAAIACEERLQRGENPARLWNADDPDFRAAVEDVSEQLRTDRNGGFEAVRDRMQPWNTAGLFDPNVANRYAYTATKT